MAPRKRLLSASLLLCLLAFLPTASGQIPAPPEPLARMQAAATSGCAVESKSLCAEAAPKIISNALGPSPLEDNLRRLTDDVGGRMTGSAAMSRAVAWAVAAFRQAGADDVRAEKYAIPVTWSEGETRLQVLSESPFPTRLVSVGWSPPTPVKPGGQREDARAIEAAPFRPCVPRRLAAEWAQPGREGAACRNA